MFRITVRHAVNLFLAVAVTAAVAIFIVVPVAHAQAPAPVPAPPPAPVPPPKIWSGSIALGVTVTRGNSDTTLLNGNILGTRTTLKNALNLGADFTYSQQKVDDGTNQTTAETEHGFIDDKFLLDDRIYGGGRVDLLHDAIANVQYRVTLAPFLGYYFIKTDVTKFSAELGPAYVFEKLGDEEDSYASIRVGERFERALSKTAKMWEFAEYISDVQDSNKYLANGEAGVETALTRTISLRLVAQDHYNSEPFDGRKNNDFIFITALAYKF